MKNQPDAWIRQQSNEIADCRVFKVREDLSRRASDGAEHKFFVIENPDWVNVIALTAKNEIVLIDQYRHGTEEIALEIPGGMVDRGEDAAIAAQRELLEETGYAAREMIFLGKSRPNTALQNNWQYHYLALDCELKSDVKFDDHESVVTKLADFSEIPQLIESGKLNHSLMVAAFYYLSLNAEFAARQNTAR